MTIPRVILKAIEGEYRDICRGAQAIYAEKMKHPRTRLEKARAEFEREKLIFKNSEEACGDELRGNLSEAAQWREGMKRAADKRPEPAPAVSTTVSPLFPAHSRAKVSLPRISFLEAHP